MLYLGIDPGSQGAACLIDETSSVLWVLPLSKIVKSNYEGIRALQGQDVLAAVELSKGMGRNGVSTIITYGVNVGKWAGILEFLGIKYEFLTPQTWQAAYLPRPYKGRTKELSFSEAQRLQPDLEWVTPRGRLKDGEADSYHIARYCKEHLA